MSDFITVNKARLHNLKGVTTAIPKNSLTVITGPSGSGKSSLAFDTIYVEGQRRYIESLSSYARQFLGQHQPPDVESIIGLSPAIAIDQKSSGHNPRSTVGTITEIYDYIRVLYARLGQLHCPDSGVPIHTYSPSQITQEIEKIPEGNKVHIMAPLQISSDDELRGEISSLMAQGFSRIRINQQIMQLGDDLPKLREHDSTIAVIIDRLVIRHGISERITDSVELALKIGDGSLTILTDNNELFFSQNNISPTTKKLYPPLEATLFSFNSPIGACPNCNGLGKSKSFDRNKIILDPAISIDDGAIPLLSKRRSFFYQMVKSFAKAEEVDLTLPLQELPDDFFQRLFAGSDKNYHFCFTFDKSNSSINTTKPFSGIDSWLKKKYLESGSEKVRNELEKYMTIQICEDCHGERLNPVALATTVGNKNIMEICALPISLLRDFFDQLQLNEEQELIGKNLLKEIRNRVQFLFDVGLDYLNLNRNANTLSGGESQRIRLATQIGSGLSGVLYVLDEPSIGLHQKDNARLLQTINNLRNQGNTILVVEHDLETIAAADHIIDMGPAAGEHGGEVVACGTPDEISQNISSLTGDYLSGRRKISFPESRRSTSQHLLLKGARMNNIKDLDVKIPLGVFSAITGVSGSGKTTLIHNILVPAVKARLKKKNTTMIVDNANYQSLSGIESLKGVIELDQSPIGRTPKSNPATYTGLFDGIRTIFANTNEAKVRGYKAGRFSFNVKGGRCEECEGNGVKKIEMHFLPDVHVTCSECKGKRYNKETLSSLFKGQSISDVLRMSVDQAADFFKNHTKLTRILSTLQGVGLGYMQLGQPATTLSGGEAQRLKLSRELSKRTTGHTLYILDEPTTGLHFADIQQLLTAIQKLVDKESTVLVIEHNLDIIKSADYIIDLGPDGGDAGGQIVASGTPEEVSRNFDSHTSLYLRQEIDK
jgi:excinuclease ABC subunit A